MASSYSTDLKLELMVTGENSGTWGTKTNTNLNLLQQAIAGYEEVSLAGGAQTITLAMTQDQLSNARNAVLKFTGSITGNQIVQLPTGIEKTYILQNATSGAYTVQVKQTGGTGVTFGTTEKNFKQVFADGTNIVDVPLGSPAGGSDNQIQFNNNGAFGGIAIGTSGQVLGSDGTDASYVNSAAGATTQIQFNNSNALGGDANLTWTAGAALTIDSEKELRLGDNTGNEYVGLKAPAAVSAAYTLTMPTATGTAGQLITTNGSGILSFADAAGGGTSWQTVKANSFTAAAGDGYFINTTNNVVTMTLPSSPTIGDEVSFVDYAGTFDSNQLTIGRNSQPIQGAASDLTVSIERAANTLVYVDGTQGWLLKNK